jgi:hypothetical protein
LSSPQVVTWDLLHSGNRSKLEKLEEKILHIQQGPGPEKQGKEEDPWNDKGKAGKRDRIRKPDL